MLISDNVLLLLVLGFFITIAIIDILFVRYETRRITDLCDTMVALIDASDASFKKHKEKLEYLELGLSDMQRIMNHNSSVFAHILGIPMDGPHQVKKEEKPKLKLVKNDDIK